MDRRGTCAEPRILSRSPAATPSQRTQTMVERTRASTPRPLAPTGIPVLGVGTHVWQSCLASICTRSTSFDVSVWLLGPRHSGPLLCCRPLPAAGRGCRAGGDLAARGCLGANRASAVRVEAPEDSVLRETQPRGRALVQVQRAALEHLHFDRAVCLPLQNLLLQIVWALPLFKNIAACSWYSRLAPSRPAPPRLAACRAQRRRGRPASAQLLSPLLPTPQGLEPRHT